MSERARILYLDDEENNLLAFKALFRREYEVFTTTSPQEAVSILGAHDIQVIFSDQKMPDLSGAEFFELTAREFPDSVRILITGYADIEAVIDAINKGQVYRYVTKPWNENDLKICLQNAVERYNDQRELREQNKRLEQVNAELEKFIYSASHDLRAPLVSIQGVVSLARAESDPSKNSDYLSMIEQSTQKLDQFIQHIVHYYQNLKSDDLISTVAFKSFAEEIVRQCLSTDPDPKIRINLDIESPDEIRTDENRLRVILGNLVGNAIKFRDNKRAEPEVSIRMSRNDKRIVIHVEDNGVGIDPNALPNIFDMFHRTPGNSPGSGIGLYITRQTVHRMGGTISVISEPGKGSRFTVVLHETE